MSSLLRACRVVLSLTLACSSSAPSAPADGGTCDEDVDCASGLVCIAHQCSRPGHADASGPPALQVDSKELDFGAVPLGVPLSLPLVVENAGGGLLEIRRIEIIEDDSLAEFGSVPAPGDVDIDLGPGQDTQIDVILTGKDLEADQAELCLYSNDPEQEQLCVALVSELKAPFLCLTPLEDPSGDPFAKCAEEVALDFGTTLPATPTTRVLAIYNGSSDSPALEVEEAQDLAITDFAADGAYPFDLELSWDIEGAEPIEAADFPLSLRSAIASSGLDADVVFAQVTLQQSEIGPVASEQLCVSYQAVDKAPTDCAPLVGEVANEVVDAGVDGSVDAGPPPPTPPFRFPWNGFATGSVWVPSSLRPKLMWEAAAGATSYELEVDDSCAVASFSSCLFPSPEVQETLSGTSFTPAANLAVSVVPPVGRRYYWRLRDCNALSCSAWSDVRYLDVGRLGKDFNGDGYADVVVGAFRQDNPELDEGNAFVYYGGPASVAATPDITLDNPESQSGARFGNSVASAGDTNADGYSDLIVGAPLQDGPENNEGNAFVYLGGPGGVASTPDITLDNPDNQTWGLFGCSVASAGDTNGDGYADVIVGAPSQGSFLVGFGSAYVYLGGSAGAASTPDITLHHQNGELFGRSVASAGDTNGDGYPEVIVGDSDHDSPESGEGNAFVYFGGSAGITDTPDITLDNPTNQVGGDFGRSVAAAGDTNGDNYADVIVGAPGQGNAFLYLGGSASIADTPDITLDNPADPSAWSFGLSVASAGDTNGDGYDDVIVGDPNQSSTEVSEGGAFVYLGGSSGIAATPDVTLDNPDSQTNARFGDSVASAGDTNGDGYADLIAGASNQNNPESSEGNAFVYLGGPGSVANPPDITLDNPANQNAAQFGSSVATADRTYPSGGGWSRLVATAWCGSL